MSSAHCCSALVLLLVNSAVSYASIDSIPSCAGAECPNLPGSTDGVDTSIFLQHRALHVPSDTVSTMLPPISRAALSHTSMLFLTGSVAHFDVVSDRFNLIYDLYAGLTLASFSIILLFIFFTLQDDKTTLRMPIQDKCKNDRSHLLDNAKFILVAMVIFQHTAQIPDGNFGLTRPLNNYWWQMLLFNTVYRFDIYTLAFISGILSRTELKATKVMISLLGPLIGYCFIIYPLSNLMYIQFFGKPQYHGASPLQMLIDSGNGLQWYLTMLIWCRVLTSLLQHFGPWVRVFMACLLQAMIGYEATPLLSLNSLKLLQTFVVGQLFPYDQALAKLEWRPITAMVGVATLAAIASFQTSYVSFGLVLGDGVPYSGALEGIAPPYVADASPFIWLRGLALTSFELFRSMVFLFLICPRQKTVFTEAGTHTLYPYLLQMLVIPWLGKAVVLTPWLKDKVDVAWPLRVLVTTADILVCGLVCAGLASKPVRFLFGWCVEPTWVSGFFIKGAEDTAAPKA